LSKLIVGAGKRRILTPIQIYWGFPATGSSGFLLGALLVGTVKRAQASKPQLYAGDTGDIDAVGAAK